MALLFPTLYKMTLKQTDFSAAEMNTRWQSIDGRLNFLELNNTITYYVPGGLTAPTSILRFPWPFKARNLSIGLAVNTAPVGSDILLQLSVGGTEVFAAGDRPKISDGDNFGTFSVNGSLLASFEEDNEATLEIDQVGSGTPGSDLAIVIRVEKVLS